MKKNIIICIVSFMLSISILLTLNMGILSNHSQLPSYLQYFIFDFKFNIVFIIILIVFFIVIFILLKILIKFFCKINIPDSKKIWSSKKIFIISLISVFISGLMFLLTYYPGVCMVDSLQLLLDPKGYSFQYPLMYSLFFSKLFNLFIYIFNSKNVAFFILGLLQLIFMSIVISYVITWFHNKFKTNILTLLTIIYFNIFTIFSNLNIAHLKDTLFSAFILLLITLIYELIETKGYCLTNNKYKFKLTIVILFLLLIRNNAIVILSILFFLIIVLYRKYIKELIVSFVIIVLVCNIKLFLPDEYNRKPLFQESIAVPLQQLFYLDYLDLLEGDSKEYIDDLMPKEIVNISYYPLFVDDIKWSLIFNRYKLDTTKKEFINIWLKNMKPHFKEYIKAYLLQTYSLWSINSFDSYESNFFSISYNDSSIHQYYNDLYNKPILPSSIYNKLDKFYKKNTVFLNNGSLFWIYVLLSLILLYKKKTRYLLLFIPFFSIWFNLMLATPYSSAFRYMCSFGYALPFMLTIIFKSDEYLK